MATDKLASVSPKFTLFYNEFIDPSPEYNNRKAPRRVEGFQEFQEKMTEIAKFLRNPDGKDISIISFKSPLPELGEEVPWNYRLHKKTHEEVPRYKVITKDQDGTSYHLSMEFLYLMDFTDIPGGMGPYSLSFRHEILFGDPSFGTEWNVVLTAMSEYIQTLPPNSNSIGVEEMSWCQKELEHNRKHYRRPTSLQPSAKSRSSPRQRSGRNIGRQRRIKNGALAELDILHVMRARLDPLHK
jgi:hypothetical protein